uniref:Secreted protein n=1 Tax=Lutzomyia longipalpis TaxID=7200 RepID=A0A1B0CF02_LUTLO
MKNIPLFLTILISLLDLRVSGNKSDGEKHEREKRFLAFPINSATGVLVALAIPLIIPNRNVFVSYNFEANYNMPTMASDLIPGPLDRLEIIDRSFGGKQMVTVQILKVIRKLRKFHRQRKRQKLNLQRRKRAKDPPVMAYSAEKDLYNA